MSSTFLLFFLALVGFSNAYKFEIVTYSCRSFTWAITLTQAEWNYASAVTFAVSELNDYNEYESWTASTLTNDIPLANVRYQFTTQATYNIPGPQWDMGLGLNAGDGDLIPGSQYDTYVNSTTYWASACATSQTYTPNTVYNINYVVPTTPSPSSTSTSTTTPNPSPTTPVPTPTTTTTPKKKTLPAIIGGIIGAVCFVLATATFLCLRKRNAARLAAANKNRSVGAGINGNMHNPSPDTEKGFVFNEDPIVNELLRDRSSGMSDYVKNPARASGIPASFAESKRDSSFNNSQSFTSPLTSPRATAAWASSPSESGMNDIPPLSPQATGFSGSTPASSRPTTLNFNATSSSTHASMTKNPLLNGWSNNVSSFASAAEAQAASSVNTTSPLFGAHRKPAATITAPASAQATSASTSGPVASELPDSSNAAAQATSMLPEPMSRQ